MLFQFKIHKKRAFLDKTPISWIGIAKVSIFLILQNISAKINRF